LPQSTKRAVDEFVENHANAGVLGVFGYENRMPEFRERIGRFIGAGGSEIAILRNTGDGANAIGGGIDWQPGDELLMCDDEFPSNAIPWLALRRRGVAVRLLSTSNERLTPDVLRRTVTARTRVVTVSWVNFADGYRHDLAGLSEVAHAAGALFVVDAIQGLGAFPIDVRACDVDAFYAGGAKWLLALQGVSFLYVKSALLDRLTIAAPGWRTSADMWDFLNYDQPPVADASRFEGGTPNFVGALSLATSIDAIDAAGVGEIAHHVLGLTDRLCEGVRRLGGRIATIRRDDCSSGIVTFTFEGHDCVKLGRAVQHEEKIVTTWRPNGIRVSPHGYNTADEIDHLLDALGRRVNAKGT
jgi:selenocysteine lyase/cysteine desulfurase